MGKLSGFLSFINNLNDWVGKIVSFLIIPMTLILVWEVLARYGFNSPTNWAHELSQFFYGAHLIMGGAYALRHRAHVNIDIIQVRLSLRGRAIVDLFIWTLFFLFCGVLLWKGGALALTAVLRQEYSASTWGPPVWPVKLTIPLGAFLILLQGLTKYIGDLYIAITGHELVSAAYEKEAL